MRYRRELLNKEVKSKKGGLFLYCNFIINWKVFLILSSYILNNKITPFKIIRVPGENLPLVEEIF